MTMIDLSTLPTIIQSIAILVVVVLVKLIIVRLSSGKLTTAKPTTATFSVNTDTSTNIGIQYFRFYCQRLSDKVNKSNNSNDQQAIAGFIALLISLAPLVIILWLFEEFVAINWLWQFLLLYFAFGNFNLSSVSAQISQALLKNEKQSAKNLLSNYCLRDTNPLSSMGLSKATIEMHLLKHLQLHFAVACCFLLIGPVMALACRLVLEMHYSWNTKLLKFLNFGQSSHLILQIILWLPSRIYYFLYLTMTIGHNFFLFWRLTRRYFFQLNTNIIIELHALNLRVKLGGVAMYNQQKLRRGNFNEQGREPEISDIDNARKQLFLVDISAIILLAIIIVLSYLPLIMNS